PYSNYNRNRLARFAMAIGRLTSSRCGASLSAASVTARISSEPIPLKWAARAAPLPSHATHAAPVWVADRLGALRRDDILVTACDHIESDAEAADAVRQATQSGNRRPMAEETGSGRVANSRR